MARRIKSNTKFSNVDILDFMKKVVEKHTRYYQSDFEIDKGDFTESGSQAGTSGENFYLVMPYPWYMVSA